MIEDAVRVGEALRFAAIGHAKRLLGPDTLPQAFSGQDMDDDNRHDDNSLKGDLAPGLPVQFISIPTLIRMKEVAGRPRDLDDIQHLRWILIDRKDDESDR